MQVGSAEPFPVSTRPLQAACEVIGICDAHLSLISLTKASGRRRATIVVVWGEDLGWWGASENRMMINSPPSRVEWSQAMN